MYKDETPNGIKRGNLVKSLFEGWRGYVTDIIYHINGSTLLGVRIAPNERNISISDRGESLTIDYHAVELVDKGYEDRMEPADTPLNFKLGDKVKDKITGFVGTITLAGIQTHGCRAFEVSPKVDKENKPGDSYWIDQHQLELVKEKPVNTTKVVGRGGASNVRGPSTA